MEVVPPTSWCRKRGLNEPNKVVRSVLVVRDAKEERVQHIAQRGEVVIRWLAHNCLKGPGHGGEESSNFLRRHDG